MNVGSNLALLHNSVAAPGRPGSTPVLHCEAELQERERQRTERQGYSRLWPPEIWNLLGRTVPHALK